MLVDKKNGTKSLRCENIVRDIFPIAQTDYVIKKLTGGQITSLALTNGFFHVPVSPESQKNTSFVT